MTSAGTLRSPESGGADVLPDLDARLGGGVLDECQLVGREPNGDRLGARVDALGASGSGCHALRIAYTERLAPLDFGVYDKSMNTTQELTDEQYDIADRIDLYLEGQGDERDFNASQLARAAKCSTGDVYPVLAWMVATSNIGVTGRGGAWVRYRQHRHGEVNR